MKRNHLFASAAIGAVLVVTLPAHSQILGGGMHGAVSGMQSGKFGGGFGAVRNSASSQTDLSASDRAGARVDGVGRLERTAKTGVQKAGGDAERAKANAVIAGRGTAGAGEFEASKASDAALGTSRATARSTATAAATAVGQGEAQVRNADRVGTDAGGLSTAEASGTKTEVVNSKPSAGQPVKPARAGSPPHSSATQDRGSPAPKSESGSQSGETARSTGSHGEIDANASTAVNASTQ